MFGLKEVSAWATETAEILPPHTISDVRRWRPTVDSETKQTQIRGYKRYTHTHTNKQTHKHLERSTWKLLINWQPFVVYGILWFSKEFHFQYLPNWDARRFSFSFISYYIVLFSVLFSVLFPQQNFGLINCLYDKICIRLVENVKWVLSSMFWAKSVPYIELNSGSSLIKRYHNRQTWW